MNELYKKYRPKTFREVLGQDAAIEILDGWLEENELPHTILFTGPSGCGKTTLARILRKEIKCHDMEFREMNSADMRGIDSAREIRDKVRALPLVGDCKVWLMDEVHKWTSECQNAMLKILEDTPSHIYFMLCTTEPEKLLRTIKNRCSEIHLNPVSEKNLMSLLHRTLRMEDKRKFPKKVAEKICSCSDGSPRKALVLLHSVMNMENTRDMMEAIQPEDLETKSIDIARALFRDKPSPTWKEITSLLKNVTGEQPEQIRRMVLGYANSVILSNPKKAAFAYLVIEAFADNYYNTGAAGLSASCYDVFKEK